LSGKRKEKEKSGHGVPDTNMDRPTDRPSQHKLNSTHYKLQTRPLVREGAPRRAKQLSGKRKEKENVVMGCSIPRRIGRLTVGHNIDSTQVTTNYRPVLSSERTPQDEEQSKFPAKERKKENLVMGCPTPTRIGHLTVGHNIDSTHYKLQTSPLVREGERKKKEKSSHGPQRGAGHEDGYAD
jgi:hypothetical protein